MRAFSHICLGLFLCFVSAAFWTWAVPGMGGGLLSMFTGIPIGYFTSILYEGKY